MGIVKSFTSTKGDNLLHTGVKDDLEKFYVFVLHLRTHLKVLPSKISQELVATIREYWMLLTCKHWGGYIGEIGTKMSRKEEKMK